MISMNVTQLFDTPPPPLTNDNYLAHDKMLLVSGTSHSLYSCIIVLKLNSWSSVFLLKERLKSNDFFLHSVAITTLFCFFELVIY